MSPTSDDEEWVRLGITKGPCHKKDGLLSTRYSFCLLSSYLYHET